MTQTFAKVSNSFSKQNTTRVWSKYYPWQTEKSVVLRYFQLFFLL
ncbi:MAG: hypothetical protein ACYDEJ_15755 [Desulfitobacteriaceae bacterium]